MEIMSNVHHKGIGVRGVYTDEISETKVNEVHTLAKRRWSPVKVYDGARKTMISKEPRETLRVCRQRGERRRHEYVCVEDLLFAIRHHSEGIEIIENCGGNVENLERILSSRFLVNEWKVFPESDEYVLQQTVGFQRVIQRAINHVRSAENRRWMSVTFSHPFSRKKIHMLDFLSEEGITRLDVLSFISHNDNKSPFRERPDEFVRPGPREKEKDRPPGGLYRGPRQKRR